MHIGIDFGTTTSRIARTTWQGAAALVPDYRDSAQLTTPSVVFVDADGALVGRPVEDWCEDQPTLLVIRDLKALAGTIEPITDAMDQAWSVEALTALLLKKLKRDVEVPSQEPIEQVAIAVPARATDAMRQSVLQAGQLAGFERMVLVDEPIAVAWHYGLTAPSAKQTILIYDWGGGGFRATVLRNESGQLTILAEQSDSRWSGRALDDSITNLVAEQFLDEHSFDPRTDPSASVTLRRQAEALKIKLLAQPFGAERVTFFLGGRVTELLLFESDIRQLVEPMLTGTLDVTEQALRASGLTLQSVDRVALSGELSAAPLVEQALRQRLPRSHEQLLRHQPSLAIACGAALWAKMWSTFPTCSDSSRSDRARHEHVGNVLHEGPHGLLGFHTLDPQTGELKVDPVIASDVPLPASGTRMFFVNRPDQTQMVLELLHAPDIDRPGVSLGHVTVPLQQPRTNPAVEVTVEWSATGTITVIALDAENDQQTAWTFEAATPDNDGRWHARLKRTPLRD